MNAKIEFLTLTILKVIVDRYRQNKVPPSIPQLYNVNTKAGLVNDWMRFERIGTAYATEIRSRATLQKHLEKLREAGFLIPAVPGVKTSFTPTPAGIALIDSHPNWREWPVSALVEGNEVLWEKANYVPR